MGAVDPEVIEEPAEVVDHGDAVGGSGTAGSMTPLIGHDDSKLLGELLL